MSADPTTIIAALVIVLIGKWLQPSGFPQNVERTHRIVSGQDVILQALGMITIHNLTIMLRTDEVSGVRGRAATSIICCAGVRVFCTTICLKPASSSSSKSLKGHAAPKGAGGWAGGSKGAGGFSLLARYFSFPQLTFRLRKGET
jgi:hypothetical protein